MIFEIAGDGKPFGQLSETIMAHKLYAGELRPTDVYWDGPASQWRMISEYGSDRPTSSTALNSANYHDNAPIPDRAALILDPPTGLGLFASLMLLLGVFAPALSIPLLGSVNYFQGGRGGGVVILTIAAISAVLSVRRLFVGLWFTGFAATLCLVATFIALRVEIANMKSSAGADKMFVDLASAAADAIQLAWSYVVLLIAAAVLLCAAAIGTGKVRIVTNHVR